MATEVNNTDTDTFDEKGIRMTGNKPTPKQKMEVLFQNSRKSSRSYLMPWETGFSRPVEDVGYGSSKYDIGYGGDPVNIPTYEYENYKDNRAEQQGWLSQLGLGATRLFTTAATTAIDNLVGTAYGLGQMIIEGISTGEWGTEEVYEDEQGNLYHNDRFDIDRGLIIDKTTGEAVGKGKIVSSYNKSLNRFVQNDVSEGLHAFNENVRNKWLPIYTSTQYDENENEGKWWRNLNKSAWWGNALDNMGFTVGSALAMYVTGGSLFGRAKSTNKLRNFIRNESIEGMEKVGASERLSKAIGQKAANVLTQETNSAEALGRKLTGGISSESIMGAESTIARNASKLHRQNIAWNITGSVLGIIGEARQESLGVGDQLADQVKILDEEIDNQIENIDDYINEQMPGSITDLEIDGRIERVYSPEAQQLKKQLIEQLEKKRQDGHELYANMANSLANSVWLYNMAVLSLSNGLAYNQFLSPSTQFAKANTKGVVKESWRSISKNLEKEGFDKGTRKAIIKELKAVEKAGGYAGQSVRQMQKSWWHTRGKLLGKGLLSTVRETMEEMTQGVAQEAALYSSASTMNEFMGYAMNSDGADKALSFYNSIGEGANRTFLSSKGWEEGFMGALTSLLPIPGLGLHMNKRRNKTGQKQTGLRGLFRVENEFWNGLFGNKEIAAHAQKLADAYNAYYNDPNGRNTALLDCLVRNDSLDKAMQDAIDNGDDFNIIGINNKKLWNIATLYSKLDRMQELKDQLDEIAGFDDRELGEQVLSQYAQNNEDYSEKLHQFYNAEEIGRKVKENAVKYKDKLEQFSKTQNKIYNLYGNVELGDFTDDFLTEMTYMTMEASSAESRFADLLEKTVPTLQNIVEQMPLNTRAILAQDVINLEKFIAKYKTAKSDSEKVGLMAQLFNDKQMVQSLINIREKIDQVMTGELNYQNKERLKQLEHKEKNKSEELTDDEKNELKNLRATEGKISLFDGMLSDSDQFFTDVNDLFKLLAVRRDYINKINRLATAPQEFVDAAEESIKEFEAKVKAYKRSTLITKHENDESLEQLDELRQQIGNEQEFSEILKELSEKGNNIAGEYYRMRNFNKHVIVELQLQEYRNNKDIKKQIAELREQMTGLRSELTKRLNNIYVELDDAYQSHQFTAEGLRKKIESNQQKIQDYQDILSDLDQLLADLQEEEEDINNAILAAEEENPDIEMMSQRLAENRSRQNDVISQSAEVQLNIDNLATENTQSVQQAEEHEMLADEMADIARSSIEKPIKNQLNEIQGKIDKLSEMEYGKVAYHNAKILYSILANKATSFAELSNIENVSYEEFKQHFNDEIKGMYGENANANMELPEETYQQMYNEAMALLSGILQKYKSQMVDKQDGPTLSSPKPIKKENQEGGQSTQQRTERKAQGQNELDEDAALLDELLEDPEISGAVPRQNDQGPDAEVIGDYKEEGEVELRSEVLSLGEEQQQPKNDAPIIVQSNNNVVESNTNVSNNNSVGSKEKTITNGEVAPFLQEFDTSSKSGHRFQRFINTEQGKGYTVLYNYLKDNGAFEYVDRQGNITTDTVVYLAIDKTLDDNISSSIGGRNVFSVLLVVKQKDGTNQIVGSLSSDDIRALGIENELREKTQYDTSEGLVVSDMSMKVKSLKTGYVLFNTDGQMHSLSEANVTKPDIYYRRRDGSWTKLGENGVTDKIPNVKNQTSLSEAPGVTYLVVPTIDKSNSIAVQLQFNKYNPVTAQGKLRDHANELWTIVEKAIKDNDRNAVSRLPIVIDQYFTFKYNKEGVDYSLKADMTEGGKIVFGLVEKKDGVQKIDTIEVSSQEDFERLLSQGYIDGYTTEYGESYVQDLINSNAFSCNYNPNLDNPLASKSNWFTLDTNTLKRGSENDTEETTQITETIPDNQNNEETVSHKKGRGRGAETVFRLQDEAQETSQSDIDAELNRLYQMLPQFNSTDRVKIVNDFIRVAGQGKIAGGMFSNGMMTISRMAERGTTYHEAFHAVFRLLMTPEEQAEIMNEARKVWVGKNDVELEENLAEGFREYVMTRDEYGLGKKILEFFKRLLGLAENWEQAQNVFNRVYNDIYEGKFGERKLEKDYTQEMQEIKARAIANGTFMKAPNGKPTNLNERQWLQVRTKAFKDWFGDWETLNTALLYEDVLEKDYLYLLPDNDLISKVFSQQKWIEIEKKFNNSLFRGTGYSYQIDSEGNLHIFPTYDNLFKNVGVSFSSDYNSALSYGMRYSKQPFIYEIDKDYIDNIYPFKKDARTNDKNVRASGDLHEERIFTDNEIIIPKEHFNVTDTKVDINLDNVSLLDIYRLIDNANYETELVNNAIGEDSDYSTLFSDENIEKLYKKKDELLKKLKDSVSKVVDENGEPLVVYHNSDTNFNEFYTKGEKYGTLGAWFTTNKEYIKRFGDISYAVFLNSRNIIEYKYNGTVASEMGSSAVNNFYKKLKEENIKFDTIEGISIPNRSTKEKVREIVVFNPNQIKSATDNNGEFSLENNNTRYRIEEQKSLYQIKQQLNDDNTIQNNTELSKEQYDSLTEMEKQVADKCNTK